MRLVYITFCIFARNKIHFSFKILLQNAPKDAKSPFSNVFNAIRLDSPGQYPTTTGIKEVKNEFQNTTKGKWYNLMGVEVIAPSKGVYIHNGKKVVLK